MSYQLVSYVAVVEVPVDGVMERHVLKATGVPQMGVVRQHLQQIHPDMKIISLERADPKNPIDHIVRVKDQVEAQFPGQEPLTPERLTESANAANEQRNAAAAEKLA